MIQTPLTNQVISPAALQLYILTTCNNLVNNYPRALLWVVHANLVLYPPASMPQYNLGVLRLWLRLRLSRRRDLCGRVGESKQKCLFHVLATMLLRQPRAGFVHQRTQMSTLLSWCSGGYAAVVMILWIQPLSNSCASWNNSCKSGIGSSRRRYV